MGAAVADVGRFYGLPTQCGINSSGAKEPGWQSALDDTTTTFLSLAAGVDMLTGIGMVSGGRIFSYEEMALAADTMSQARAVAAGIDLSGLAAADAAAEAPAPPAAGASAHRASQPHRYWAAGGRQTAVDRAHERVARIVEGHRPPPLDAGARRGAAAPRADRLTGPLPGAAPRPSVARRTRRGPGGPAARPSLLPPFRQDGPAAASLLPYGSGLAGEVVQRVRVVGCRLEGPRARREGLARQ